ncbi:hypothetical protein ACJ41O_000723 [Fusarium nematophilum]
MFPLVTITSLLAIAGAATATLDPALSNTQGKFPQSPGCAASAVSDAIQAAECSHNTRVAGQQTFAIFRIDHQFDGNNGAPYGTCEAYECEAPTGDQLTDDDDTWTFFWNDNGESPGDGAGCIKDPNDGLCGCENSDGTFIPRASDCV